MSKTAAERQRECRQRKRDSVTPKNVTGVTADDERDTPAIAHVTDLPVGLEHYYANPDMYAHRAHPDELNWGKWMNSHELEQAGIRANRVPIPGDWDYEGVCSPAPGPAPGHEQAGKGGKQP